MAETKSNSDRVLPLGFLKYLDIIEELNDDYEVNEYDETIKLLATDKNIAFIQNIIAPRIKSNVDNISISFDENKRYITEIKLINREVKELINL